MSIYRKSCRITERVQMKKYFAQGKSVKDISTKLRVVESVITEVVEGVWDATEKRQTLAAMKVNEEKMIGKADAEANKIAQIASAAAAAIQGQSPVVDQVALRNKIEEEIRAEIRAEIAAKPVELTSGQKAAATRKANLVAKANEEAADAQAA